MSWNLDEAEARARRTLSEETAEAKKARDSVFSYRDYEDLIEAWELQDRHRAHDFLALAALYRATQKWSRRWKKLAEWRGWPAQKHERTRRLYREAIGALEPHVIHRFDPHCKTCVVLAKARAAGIGPEGGN